MSIPRRCGKFQFILVHRIRFARVTDGLLTQVEHGTYASVSLTALASVSDTNTPTTSHHMASAYSNRMPPVKQSANPSVIWAQWKDRAVNYFVSKAPDLSKNRTISGNSLMDGFSYILYLQSIYTVIYSSLFVQEWHLFLRESFPFINVAILEWVAGADVVLSYRGINTCYQVYCIFCPHPVSLPIHITTT